MAKKSKVIVPKMVNVKAEGRRYTMGSTDDANSDECFFETGFDYDFQIGQFQVTQEEYESLMGNNPSNFKGKKNPVECVSWWDAIKYCNALSRSQGKPVAYNEETGELLDEKGNVTKDLKLVKGYRLPMESEWEYAARGGELSKGYKFAGSDNVDEVAWYNTDSTKPVGLKKPNELGIYDMSGNVWEWCYDKYVKNRNKPDEDWPMLGYRNSVKVIKGKCYATLFPSMFVSSRGYMRNHMTPLGFRIILFKEN